MVVQGTSKSFTLLISVNRLSPCHHPCAAPVLRRMTLTWSADEMWQLAAGGWELRLLWLPASSPALALASENITSYTLPLLPTNTAKTGDMTLEISFVDFAMDCQHRQCYIMESQENSFVETASPLNFVRHPKLVLWKQNSWVEQRRLRRDLQRNLAVTSATPAPTSAPCSSTATLPAWSSAEFLQLMICSFSERQSAHRAMSAKKCQNCGSTDIESDATRFISVDLELWNSLEYSYFVSKWETSSILLNQLGSKSYHFHSNSTLPSLKWHVVLWWWSIFKFTMIWFQGRFSVHWLWYCAGIWNHRVRCSGF